MRIINKEILDLFVKKHADAAKPVNRWIEVLEDAKWQSHNELKELFPNADYIGNSRYVFNIKGNDYRIVAIIIFVLNSATVCFIGTHAEYNKIDCSTVIQ